MFSFSFICPHCADPLFKQGSDFFCKNNHHFDAAKEGYVNLLPPNSKASKDPGDSADMIAARTQFLEKGWYKPLADAVADLCIKNVINKEPVIADIGCGQGYYTQSVYRKIIAAGMSPVMAGIDISRHAVRAAAKRDKDIRYAVASVIKLPFADSSVDVLLNIFAPRHFPEFSRVLVPNGHLIVVSPGPRHLAGLKAALGLSEDLHDEPAFIPEVTLQMIQQKQVEETITLTSPEDILHLCMMTPFWWKMTRESREAIAGIKQVTVTTDFTVSVFQKS